MSEKPLLERLKRLAYVSEQSNLHDMPDCETELREAIAEIERLQAEVERLKSQCADLAGF